MSSSFVRKLITDFFPPPKFLEMPSVGIDISDEVIRFAELKRKGRAFELGVFGKEKIPPGIIEQGYIKDKDGLSKILEGIRKKYGFYFIKASLPDEKAYLFKTQIPAMEVSDIRSALQYKIEENVPIALADAVYDYVLIKNKNEDASHLNVGVTVMHTKVVSSYLDVFHKAGLMPLKFRTEAQAIARAVIPAKDASTYIIASVRETKTVLAIVSNNVVQFTSTVPLGGASIASSLKKQFNSDDKEVESIRNGTVVKDSNEIMMALVNSVSILRDEIKKIFLYWDGHNEPNDHAKISQIILSGSDTLLGLDKYLAQSFNVPVTIGNAWINILSLHETIPSITHHESLDYVPVLGLAFPHD